MVLLAVGYRCNSFHNITQGEEVRCLNHYQCSRSVSDAEYQDYSRQKQFYISTYNPNREGEYKGSLYIYDADSGELVNKYEGISYEPVSMFYKIK